MNEINNRPIGIFDSGVGGLTVAKSVLKILPNEDIIYFGDTARVPYGNKSKGTIIRFASEIVDFLTARKVKMVIVACNTASSLSLKHLKEKYSIPIMGVISPGVEEALRVSVKKRIGVIGTKSTVGSRAYEKALKKLEPGCKVFSTPCPLFVPLVENKFLDGKITREVAKHYLKGLGSKKIDTLILGCTHYPLLEKVISRLMPGVTLVDSPSAVAREVSGLLKERGIEAARKRDRGRMKCYVSDDPEGFRRITGIFLRKKIMVSKAVI